MPRCARIKSHDSIFHIMAKSITEVDLFKDDDDKKKYLSLVKKYQILYEFRVYGYCLMTNHLHFLIDANGADISKIMHSINFSYALYFNKKHKRHGHLFQDRFRSKIITDDRYLMNASIYIHNNSKDIGGYQECPEKYEFSSLGIYLGLKQDPYELIEDSFVKSLFGKDKKISRSNYIKLVYKCSNKEIKEDIEFDNEITEYRSGRKILVRNCNADAIIEFVACKMNIPKYALALKGSRRLVNAKALAVVLMRSLCNLKCSDICRLLGNITQMRVSNLSSLGINLIIGDDDYANILKEFLNSYAA